MIQATIAVTLLFGFLGSWHCGVMCGPLGCNFNQKSQFSFYHSGRLISYLLITVFLFSGKSVLFENTQAQMLGSLLFALIFIIYGLIRLGLFAKLSLHQFKSLNFLQRGHLKLFRVLHGLSRRLPFLLGLLTGLFPCAWLYSFLLMAIQMKTLSQALLIVLIFWITSLPAFWAVTGSLNYLIKNSPHRYRQISGVVLIIAGLLAVLGHWAHSFI